MSKSKSFIACLSVLLAAALFSGSALIDEDRMTEQTFNYKTAEATIGTFEKSAAMSAMVYYTRANNIRYRGNSANFGKYRIKQGRMVKEGDVIATVTVNGSRVELETMKMQLARLEKNYEEGLSEREEALRKAQKNAATETDNARREVLRLECERMQLETDAFALECEYQIDSLTRDIARTEEEFENTEIRAEYDGEVEKIVTSLKEGDLLYDGSSVGKLQDPTSAILVARDDGKLRYGMDVIISSGAKTQRVEYRAKVIAADNVLPYELRRGYAGIEILDEWDPEKIRNPYVNYKAVSIQNVLTIPKRAVNLDKGNYYVSILDGNAVKRRIINFSLYTPDSGIVLQGLEEGDQVILN